MGVLQSGLELEYLICGVGGRAQFDQGSHIVLDLVGRRRGLWFTSPDGKGDGVCGRIIRFGDPLPLLRRLFRGRGRCRGRLARLLALLR